MKQSEAVQQSIGYIKACDELIKILNKIDMTHPEYPMPMELWCDLKKMRGDAESFLWERGVDPNETLA